MSDASTAFVFGLIFGACGVLTLTGLALWLVDVREALRDASRQADYGVETRRKLLAGEYGERLQAEYERRMRHE